MKKQTLLWIFVGLAIAVGLTTWWLAPFNPKQPRTIAPTSASPQSAATIAEAWDWDAFSLREKIQATEMDERAAEQASNSPDFDVVRIYQTLQQIKLDSNGNIILDSTVLNALQQALEFSDVEWTPENLAKFKDIVASGLPGIAGQQAVELIDDYHQYAKATKEFETMVGPGDETTSIDEYAQQYQELTNLREMYLGKEVAESLFAEEEAGARYMMDSYRLADDPNLSDAERQARQAELADNLENRAPNIPQWNTRYQAFKQEKQAILDAGISEADKKNQVKALIEQHFNESEQAQADHLKLDEF